MSAGSVDTFDPFDAEYLRDPYPMLDRIRETSPALFIEKHNVFLVTRYADVVAASKAHAIFSSTGGVGIEWKSRPMMPMYDPPEHTQLRRIVAPFFTPRAVAAHEPAVRRATEAAIDAALARGRTDLVKDIAEPISIRTLAAILGVPPEHQADLRRWANNTMADLAGGVPKSEVDRVEAMRKEFISYLRNSVSERRKSLGTDLISVLLRATDEQAMTEKELVGFCVLLLVAGFEPSASALANVALALVNNAPDLDALPTAPDARATAVDEFLRWDSPVQAFFRNTLTDTMVDGVPIPKGSKVMIHFAAANRDPRVFDSPEKLVLARSPNPHIAFGAGIHHCLGAALARMQVATFLDVLRQKARAIQPFGVPTRADNLLFRVLSSFPVELMGRR